MSAPSPELPPGPPAGGFWRRRLLDPLRRQLVQGVTPRKLAATLAVGTVCSLFPFLGFTSLLNLAVGIALRLNQPLLQGWNQLLGPLQLPLVGLAGGLRSGRDQPMQSACGFWHARSRVPWETQNDEVCHVDTPAYSSNSHADQNATSRQLIPQP